MHTNFTLGNLFYRCTSRERKVNIAILFVKAKYFKLPKCPLIGNWLKELRHSNIIENCAGIENYDSTLVTCCEIIDIYSHIYCEMINIRWNKSEYNALSLTF